MSFGEKFEGLVNGHVEDVEDAFVAVFNAEDFFLEPFAFAVFTFEVDVGHELHLYGDDAFALADFTSSALYVEGKMRWLLSAVACQREIGVEGADLVVGFDVGNRIGAR